MKLCLHHSNSNDNLQNSFDPMSPQTTLSHWQHEKFENFYEMSKAIVLALFLPKTPHP